jgi:multimeric flavodoxin WrbA
MYTDNSDEHPSTGKNSNFIPDFAGFSRFIFVRSSMPHYFCTCSSQIKVRLADVATRTDNNITKQRMKNILVINGSQKSADHSTTAGIARNLLLETGFYYPDFHTEFVALGEAKLKMCTGCKACSKTGVCVQSDSLNGIIHKIKAADFVILGTPVYISHVSATYKNFLDRLNMQMHNFEFIGKPFVSVVSTNGSGEQETLKYMNHTALLLGMIRAGSVVHFNSDPSKTNHQIDKLAPKIAGMLSGSQPVKPSIKNRLYFWWMKKIIRENKAYFKYEYNIWQQKGWFEMNYTKAVQPGI